MPKSPIPAPGEAVPVTRRAAILGAAAAMAAIPVAAATDSDPLLKAIAAYREGEALYNATPSPDAELLLDRPHAVLANWRDPATTRAGAVEALRLAVDISYHTAGDPAADSLVVAALGYFEREGK